MIKFIGPKDLISSTTYEDSTVEECTNWIKTLTEVNLDTETEGLFDHNNKILMLQLNWLDITYVIDVRSTNIIFLKSYCIYNLQYVHNTVCN